MISTKSNQNHLVNLFKISTIVHILCLIANLVIRPYIAADNIINNIINCGGFASVIAISIIVGMQTMQFFTDQHKYLMLHYKFLGLVIESCLATCIGIILFFNQEITNQFIMFIANLSHQAYDNHIVILMILLLLIFCIELYHAYEINKKSIETQSLKKIILFHLVSLALKLSIIVGTAIGFIHPVVQILEPIQLQQFDSLIFHFTTTEIFLYIHTIIMMLLVLWITIGAYYVYKFYNPTTLDDRATEDKRKRS